MNAFRYLRRANGHRLGGASLLATAVVVLSLTTEVMAQTPEKVKRAMEGLDVSCDRCHTCTDPTAGEACLRSCTRAEMLRREREFSAKRGPRVVILDELEDVYLPVAFDHEGHSAMGQMAGGCSLCHHYTPEGMEHPACKTCHEINVGQGDIRKPGLKGAYHRQCLSCHREWGGETRCSICHHAKSGPARAAAAVRVPTPDDLVGRMHPPIPEPEVEIYQTEREGYPPSKAIFRHKEHVHSYGLRCAECHREDSCNRCHEAGKKHEQRQRTLDEHHKPCLECHRNDACESCHYETGHQPPPPFDHGRTGWPLTRYHKDKGCRACHTTVPFGPQEKECNACHKAWSPTNFDHAVTGQILDDNHSALDCVACHADRRFDRTPVCSDCHEDDEGITFPARRPGPVREVAK